VPDLQAQQVGGAFLQQALAFLVEVREAALPVQRHEGLGDAGQRCGQPHGEAQRFLLRLLLSRDVEHGTLHPHDQSLCVAHGSPTCAPSAGPSLR